MEDHGFVRFTDIGIVDDSNGIVPWKVFFMEGKIKFIPAKTSRKHDKFLDEVHALFFVLHANFIVDAGNCFVPHKGFF